MKIKKIKKLEKLAEHTKKMKKINKKHKGCPKCVCKLRDKIQSYYFTVQSYAHEG